MLKRRRKKYVNYCYCVSRTNRTNNHFGFKKPKDLIVPDLLAKAIEPGKKLISVDVRENLNTEISTNDIETTIADIQSET